MLSLKEQLRTGFLLFPLHEHVLHNAPFPCQDLTNRDIPKFEDNNSDEIPQLLITSTEISSGYTKLANILPGIPNLFSSQWFASSEYIVVYVASNPIPFRVFSLSLNQWIPDCANVNISAGNNNTPKKISLCCQPKLHSNYFIFVLEDDTIQTMLIQRQANSEDPPVVRIAPRFSLRRILSLRKIKVEGKVASVASHPTKPLIVVGFSEGTVLICSYERNLKTLVRGSVENSSNVEESNDEVNAEEDNPGDDLEIESNPAGDKLAGSRGFFRDRAVSKLQQKLFLSVVATFELPSAQALAQMDESFKGLVLFPDDIKINFTGKLAGVIFSQSIVLLYDLTSINNLRSFYRDDTSIISLKFVSCFPLHTPPPSTFKQSNYDATMEYKFRQLSFHPHLPLLFLAVARRKMFPRVHLQSSTSSSKQRGSSMGSESSPFYLPVAPMIYAISLIKLTSYLGAISSHELHFLESTPGLNNRSSSLNLAMDFMDCSPVSGLLTLNFRINTALQPLSGQAITAQDLSQEHLFCTLSLTQSWKQKQGLLVFESTIANQISVPPEVFLFGLTALSRYAGFSPKSDTATTKGPPTEVDSVVNYKCQIKYPNAEQVFQQKSFSTTYKYGLPSLFLIKASEIGVLDSGVYSIYEMDYLPSIFGQKSASAQEPISAKTIAPRFIANLPMILTAESVKQMIRESYKWLKLDKNDYWLPSASPSDNASVPSSKFERRNSKSISSDQNFFFFSPTIIQSWGVTPCQEQRLGKRFTRICVKGIMRRLAENTVINVLPTEVINAAGNELIEPVICLINPFPDEGSMEASIISARDAAFVSSDTTPEIFCLVLDKTGKFLKVFEYDLSKGSSSSATVISSQKTVSLDFVVERLWFNDVSEEAIFLTEGGEVHRYSLSSILALSKLSIERLRSVKDASLTKFPFELLPDEQLQEFAFSPISQSFDEKRVPIPSISEFFHPQNRLMAILTSKRVLVFTERSDGILRIVEVLWYRTSRSIPCIPSANPQLSTTERIQRASFSTINYLSTRDGQGTGSAIPFPSASSKSATSVVDEIISIQFVGCALLLTGVSGCIRYLIPKLSKGHRPESTVKVPSICRLIQRALGKRQDNCTRALGTLACLPRNLSPHYPLSFRVISLFPDRLLVVYADRLPQFNSVRFHQSVFPSLTFRPINPFEMLIASTISAAEFNPKATPHQVSEVCSQIIQLYAPILPSDAYSSLNNRFARYVPSRQLLLVLTDSWFADSSSPSKPKHAMTLSSTIPVFADLLISPSNRTETKSSEPFPSGQALPSGTRAFWKFASTSLLGLEVDDQRASNFLELTEAALEILYDNGKSVLVDLLTTNETFGGAHLPLRGSALAKRISSLARLLVLLSKRKDFNLTENDFISILKLFDIAADYSNLFEWLRTCEYLVSPDSVVLKEIAEEFGSEVQRLSKSDIRSFLKFHSQKLEDPAGEGVSKLKDFLQSHRLLSLPHITKAQRKSSLHSSLLNLVSKFKSKKQKAVSKLQPLGPDIGMLRKSCLTSLQKQGGIIIGPYWSDLGAFPLKVNALDLIEEFMATQQHFEYVEGSSGFAGEFAHGDMGASSSPFFEMQPSLPLTWVENVGVGRELDKVSAYFRFSDVFLPGEQGFVCSAEPFTRLVFLDLSRYEGPGLELFYENSLHKFSIDSTQSNINSGDRHESTKSLCDVTHVVEQALEDRSGSGLRLLVTRGSPLDIGCYHRSPQRSKFTLEMHIALEHPQNLQNVGKPIVLCERKASATLSLWRLEVSENGFLRFFMGSTWISSEKNSFNLFTNLERRCHELKEGRDDDEDDERVTLDRVDFSPFAHLALIVDSSSSTCDCRPVSDDFLLAHSSPIRVILYVDGEKAIDNQVEIKPEQIQETQLARTHLFFMPNASVNYRLTELRVWSDFRSTQEITDQRENYLLLAEKRCRLQMQLKGTRKLFSAFRDIVVGPPCNSLIEPISTTVTQLAVPKNNSSVQSTRFSLALPTTTTGIVAPSGTDVGAANSIIPPTSATSSTLTARQKRLSMLKDGGNALKPHTTPADVGHIQPQIPASELVPTQNSSNIPTVKVAAFETSFSAFGEHPPPAPIKAPLLPQISAEIKEEPSTVSVKPFANTVEVRTRVLNGLNYSENLSTVSNHWENSIFWRSIQKRRTKLLSVPSILGFLSSESSIEIIYSVVSESSEISRAMQISKLHCKSITIPSDLSLNLSNQDCVLSFSHPSKTPHCQVAICGNKSLDIVEISSPFASVSSSTISRVVSLPLVSTPLVYFFYLTPELMVLITPSEGFTWKPSIRDDGSGKTRYDPIRILHRVDLQDMKSWQERSVLDVSVSAERWTMITSCDNYLRGKGNDLRSHVVSIHHAKSGKALSFRAVAGSFKAPGQLILLFFLESTQGWKLTLFDLQHMVEVASSGVESLRHPKDISNPHYLTPFEYSEIAFTTIVETSSATSVPNADSVPILTGVWSISLPSLVADQSTTIKRSNSLEISLLAATIYQINDKVFVLSCCGIIALVDATSLKCYGQASLLSDNDEGIVSTTLDFSDIENPVVVCVVRSNQSTLTRTLAFELKSVAKTIKSQFKGQERT